MKLYGCLLFGKFFFLVFFLSVFCACTPPWGEFILNFRGSASESYRYLSITFDRIDVHDRGQDWKLIGENEYTINLVVDGSGSGFLSQFRYKMSKGIMDLGEYTELRIRVTSANFRKNTGGTVSLEIPEKNKNGYSFAFPEGTVIENLHEDLELNLIFNPEMSIVVVVEGSNYILDLKGKLEKK